MQKLGGDPNKSMMVKNVLRASTPNGCTLSLKSPEPATDSHDCDVSSATRFTFSRALEIETNTFVVVGSDTTRKLQQ